MKTLKVKKFKNIWTMGLILFCSILVLFYVIKLVNPSFIVGVAELPAVVKFGNYVDNHRWAYYIFNFVISYAGGYLYYCACCRKYKLSLKQNLLFISFLILGYVLQHLLPNIANAYNYSTFILIPFLMMLLDNQLNKSTFISMCCCYVIDIMSQALSREVRDIIPLVSIVNSATLTILLIDGFIWRIILYLYYNNKKEV